MARDLLRDIERTEAQILAVGQLARRLLADHQAPARRVRIEYRHAPDSPTGYVMALDIWARDAQALWDWADALDARIDSRPATDDDLGTTLSARTVIGTVPVRVWVMTGDPAETARHQDTPTTAAVTA
ncbi:hypothetical protein [Streptomyces sp. NBC_01262]|uniref:hypothetical protein n=1 Tax=Streptomyces sp. NBC_01262 TaxID=2903803 RepID=UPI002E37BE32|nr:hypothetical protein [Streptomyces sp. NBC_01262]